MPNLTLEGKAGTDPAWHWLPTKSLCTVFQFYGGCCPAHKGRTRLHRLQRGNASLYPHQLRRRPALFKAVADGVTEFTDIAVVGSRRGG